MSNVHARDQLRTEGRSAPPHSAPELGSRARSGAALSPVDQELAAIEQARSGDHQAMTLLLTSYQTRVFGICYRMVGHFDDAADLTQDVLTKMLTSLDDFNHRAAFSTWVYRIAMNAAISHLRRRKTLRKHHLSSGITRSGTNAGVGAMAGNQLDSIPDRRHDRELSASGGVEQDESARLLQQALLTLSEEARALLVLRDVRDLDYDRIGEILGLPLGTVKSRLFRARLALRKSLQRVDLTRRSSVESSFSSAKTPDRSNQ